MTRRPLRQISASRLDAPHRIVVYSHFAYLSIPTWLAPPPEECKPLPACNLQSSVDMIATLTHAGESHDQAAVALGAVLADPEGADAIPEALERTSVGDSAGAMALSRRRLAHGRLMTVVG